MALAMSSRAAPPQRLTAAPPQRLTAAPRARARRLPRCAPRTAAMLQDLRKGALGAGGAAIGSYVCPTLLNNCPHPREVRQHFYGELTRGVLAAVKDGKTRMRSFQQFPETNVEMDVYRIGTLLEGIRELVTTLAADGKRVRVCVQGSMGTGAFTAMPLQLAGVRRIMEMMDWGDGEPGTFVRLGGVGAAEVAADDDLLIVIAPQNITGHSVMPFLQDFDKAAGSRPILLVNPRLDDIPSANAVMQVRGREERMAYAASYEEIYHFRLIYNKPYHFPIYGCLRHVHGSGAPWELFKRTGRAEEEAYRFVQAFNSQPDPEQITEGIARDPA